MSAKPRTQKELTARDRDRAYAELDLIYGTRLEDLSEQDLAILAGVSQLREHQSIAELVGTATTRKGIFMGVRYTGTFATHLPGRVSLKDYVSIPKERNAAGRERPSLFKADLTSIIGSEPNTHYATQTLDTVASVTARYQNDSGRAYWIVLKPAPEPEPITNLKVIK